MKILNICKQIEKSDHNYGSISGFNDCIQQQEQGTMKNWIGVCFARVSQAMPEQCWEHALVCPCLSHTLWTVETTWCWGLNEFELYWLHFLLMHLVLHTFLDISAIVTHSYARASCASKACLENTGTVRTSHPGTNHNPLLTLHILSFKIRLNDSLGLLIVVPTPAFGFSRALPAKTSSCAHSWGRVAANGEL